jgi:hypothetical protein
MAKATSRPGSRSGNRGGSGSMIPQSTPGGVGIFLIAFGIFTRYMTVAALRTNGALIAVFAFLTLTFFALGIGAAAGAEGLTRLGGWLGIITALIAWYTSFAGVLNSTFKRVVLPVFPRA